MGVKQSSDIAQETMEQILSDLDDVEIYIDDVGFFFNEFPGSHSFIGHYFTSFTGKLFYN
jgi:hypothetical protein